LPAKFEYQFNTHIHARARARNTGQAQSGRLDKMQTDWFYWADSASAGTVAMETIFSRRTAALNALSEKSKLDNKCVVIDECFS